MNPTTLDQKKPTSDQARYTIATAGSMRSKSWKHKTVGWDWLGEQIVSPIDTDDKKSVPGYVAGSLKADGRRVKETILNRCWITLDVEGKVTADQIEGIKAAISDKGWRCWGHTTFSHAPDDQHWRFVLPIKEPVSPDQYRALAAEVMVQLGGDGLFDVGASTNPEQLMFVPSTPDIDSYECWRSDGSDAVPAGPVAGATQKPPDGPQNHEPPVAATAATAQHRERAEALLKAAADRLPGLEDGRYGELSLLLIPLYRFVLADCYSREHVHEVLLDALGSEYSGTDNWRDATGSCWVTANKEGPDLPRSGDAADDFGPLPPDLLDTTPELEMEREVLNHLRNLRIRDEAKRRFELEKHPPELVEFDIGTLSDVLARPPEPEDRIGGMAPWNGSTLIVAQRKTGKTTLVLNLARSLLTGSPFLGRFDVVPIAGRIAMLNFEVSAAQVARWADEAGVDQDMMVLVNLRGRRNPFRHPDDQARLAALLRGQGVESLIVDPFGRAFTGTSQNDAGEVQSFLVQLDEFAREQVGALDLFLTAHAGWNGERTRGSSALEDWADSIWTMTRDAGEDNGERYLKAEGRDVDVPEVRLVFDPEGRRLTAGEGNRRQNRQDSHLDELADRFVEYVTGHPGESTAAIEKELKELGGHFQRGDVSKAARKAVEDGRVVVQRGSRNARLFYSSDLPRPTPTYPTG